MLLVIAVTMQPAKVFSDCSNENGQTIVDTGHVTKPELMYFTTSNDFIIHQCGVEWQEKIDSFQTSLNRPWNRGRILDLI